MSPSRAACSSSSRPNRTEVHAMTIDPALSTFRELHRSGCFVMPNPWDAGTAKFLYRAGFRALASSSSAVAFTRGMPDRVWGLPLDAVLAHLTELVAATPLPV